MLIKTEINHSRKALPPLYQRDREEDDVTQRLKISLVEAGATKDLQLLLETVPRTGRENYPGLSLLLHSVFTIGFC